MKILVATAKAQGHRKSDFNWLTEGELVRLASECDGEAVDGSCGCRRSFAGTESQRAGTTALVIESEMTREQYYEAIMASFVRDGYAELFTPEECAEFVEDEVTTLLAVADAAPVGAVVEKRGVNFNVRLLKPVTKGLLN